MKQRRHKVITLLKAIEPESHVLQGYVTRPQLAVEYRKAECTIAVWQRRDGMFQFEMQQTRRDVEDQVTEKECGSAGCIWGLCYGIEAAVEAIKAADHYSAGSIWHVVDLNDGRVVKDDLGTEYGK